MAILKGAVGDAGNLGNWRWWRCSPRFFSTALWGTIVFPDETEQLSDALREQVITHSPFSDPLTPGVWLRWDANKHLIYLLCSSIRTVSAIEDARAAAQSSMTTLANAVVLHEEIEEELIDLRDETNVYQSNWRAAMEELLASHDDDFDYLEMLS